MKTTATIPNTPTQWGRLEIIDRASGEVETILLDDPNAAESVRMTAERLGMSEQDAWDVLFGGGALATFGFVRRLRK